MGQNAKSYSTINSEPDDEILRCAQDDSQDPSPVRSREAYLQMSIAKSRKMGQKNALARLGNVFGSQGGQDIALCMDRAYIYAECMQLCYATRKDISDRFHRAVQRLVIDRSIHSGSRATEYFIGNGSTQHHIGAILGIGLQP